MIRLQHPIPLSTNAANLVYSLSSSWFQKFGFCDVVDATGGDFSPASGRSPHSSLSSPQVNVDSPRICFSPLKIKDSVGDDDDDTVKGLQR